MTFNLKDLKYSSVYPTRRYHYLECVNETLDSNGESVLNGSEEMLFGTFDQVDFGW